MNPITIVMAVFSLIAAFDIIIGKKLGLGKEFEKGIHMLGTMTLSMSGMIILAPCIAHLLQGLTAYLPVFIDPSIIPSSLLANDMGGAPLSVELCRDQEIGAFNSMVVSSMMGCTISFTIPVALGMTAKEQHADVLYGLLCGIITIPTGCLAGGLVAGIGIFPLIRNLIPLILFSLLLAVGLLKFPEGCIKVFSVFGAFIKILITIGLAAGIFEFLTGIKLIPYSDSIQTATAICLNAACVMTGAFPLIHLLSKLLKKPLRLAGQKLQINDTAAMGLVSSLATSMTTFDMITSMDSKGVILNAAFAVSGAFVFAGHLAFTMAFNPDYVTSVIIGKLTAGILAVLLAHFMTKLRGYQNA